MRSTPLSSSIIYLIFTQPYVYRYCVIAACPQTHIPIVRYPLCSRNKQTTVETILFKQSLRFILIA